MRYAVLLSGGVDSSVALARLKQEGHEITAFYLKIWLEDELAHLGTCPWEEDLVYARAVCEKLNVPLEIISLQQEYWDAVVTHVISEIKGGGRTPNPDMLCNERVKFGAFYHKIGPEFVKVASGHYAQVREIGGEFRLFCSPDPVKDQTYFLAHLTQTQLSRALFPIGDLTKKEVRTLAEKFDLPTKDRKDSQGICFLGKLSFPEFIKHYLGERTGDLIEAETGKVVGKHQGYWYFTVGQRQGIGLAGGPWYVVAKDVAKNHVLISKAYFTPDKMRDRFTVHDCSWIIGEAPESFEGVEVKLRHGAMRYSAQITAHGDMLKVVIAGRDQGIADGQYAVLYRGDECLGGGVMATEMKENV